MRESPDKASMYWTRTHRLAGVLVLMIVVNLGANVLLTPIANRQAPPPQIVVQLWTAFVIAQPSLLAVWTVYGSERLLRRLPRSLALSVLAVLSLLVGVVPYQSLPLNQAISFLFPMFQFLFMLFPFLYFRRRRKWSIRLLKTDDMDRQPPAESRRFSIRRLIAWVTSTAILFSIARWIMANVDTSAAVGTGQGGGLSADPASAVAYCLVMGIALGSFSMPILFLMAATLRADDWSLYASFAVFVFIVELAVVGLICAMTNDREFLLVTAWTYVIATLTLFILRLTGLRLVDGVERPGGDASEVDVG